MNYKENHPYYKYVGRLSKRVSNLLKIMPTISYVDCIKKEIEFYEIELRCEICESEASKEDVLMYLDFLKNEIDDFETQEKICMRKSYKATTTLDIGYCKPLVMRKDITCKK